MRTQGSVHRCAGLLAAPQPGTAWFCRPPALKAPQVLRTDGAVAQEGRLNTELRASLALSPRRVRCPAPERLSRHADIRVLWATS